MSYPILRPLFLASALLFFACLIAGAEDAFPLSSMQSLNSTESLPSQQTASSPSVAPLEAAIFICQSPEASPFQSSTPRLGQRFSCVKKGLLVLDQATLMVEEDSTAIYPVAGKFTLLEGGLRLLSLEKNAKFQLRITGGEFVAKSPFAFELSPEKNGLRLYNLPNGEVLSFTLGGVPLLLEPGQLLVKDRGELAFYQPTQADFDVEKSFSLSMPEFLSQLIYLKGTHIALSARPDRLENEVDWNKNGALRSTFLNRSLEWGKR